ncbi:MAG: UDP-N-acetylmuramate dehydrogenase [Spirochaetia bacterium]|nr:UDP-N-acetylmuramate dehydrogenase [Spirochaetia bacterium]
MDKGLFTGINANVLTQENMADHTTFKIGGPARYFVVPKDIDALKSALEAAAKAGLKCYILGGGANVLFPDEGYDGVVIATEGLNQIFMETNGLLHAGCGAAISDVAMFASSAGRAGLQFFYSMPGSTGGAIYMNARCYNASISDALKAAVYLDREGNVRTLDAAEGGFDYKKSPFQTNGGIILEGIFATTGGNAELLCKEMEGYEADRRGKGHFAYPCAGSVFKNNRAFGLPSGKIIDNLGLRGYTVGGAKISEHHANIIVNCGNATAQDVKDLVSLIQVRVKEAYGFQLEREIIYV